MSNTGFHQEDFDDLSEIDDTSSVGSLDESPSDGYFSPRDHPQVTFVQNSSVQEESESKAREAAERQASSSGAVPPSHSSPASSTGSPAWATESTPLLYAGPPPPDYAAATSTRPHTQNISGHQETAVQNPHEPQQSIGSNFIQASDSTEQSGRQWLFGSLGRQHNANSPHQRNGPPTPGFNFPFGPNARPFDFHEQRQNVANRTVQDADPDGSGRRYDLPRWKHGREHNRRRKCARKCCKPRSFLNIALVLAVIFLITLLSRMARQTREPGNSSSNGDENRKSPIREGDDDLDSDPFNGTTPKHPRNWRCVFNYYSELTSFTFAAPSSFSLTETLERSDRGPKEISGNIWILSAPEGQDVPIKVSISYATAEPFESSNVQYDKSHDSLGIWLRKPVSSPIGCVDVAIGIYVRGDVELSNLTISTLNLNVEADKGLFNSQDNPTALDLRLINTTSIETHSGHVKLAYWSSGNTHIVTRSGSISGTYALRDLLSLYSLSGSVGVTVEPKESSDSEPTPADFAATTNSGSIGIGFPLDGEIPERDYRTHVKGLSGSISGNFIHGSETSFSSKSGSITISVLPYYAELDGGSSLRTDVRSGRTSVRVLSPYIGKATVVDVDNSNNDRSNSGQNTDSEGSPEVGTTSLILNKLQSNHFSISGSLDLVYPQEWEGMIEGETISGRITLKGKDVHPYLFGDWGLPGRQVVARKGYGESKLGFQSTSGSATVRIGDV